MKGSRQMKLIEEFRALPESRQRSVALTLAIGVLVLVISIGAFLAEDMLLGAIEGEEATQAEETTASEEDAQAAALEAYTGEARELVELLMAKPWVAEQGSVTFSADAFCENAGGINNQTWRPYQVLSTTRFSTFSLDDSFKAIVESDGSYGEVIVSPMAAKTAGVPALLSVESDLFTVSTSYVEKADESFAVTGMTSEALALAGGDEKGLRDALRAFCAEQYPAVAEVEWAKSALIDYDLGTVAYEFKAKNRAGTALTALYTKSDKSWVVKSS